MSVFGGIDRVGAAPRPMFVDEQVTDASGHAIFNFPAGLFTATPHVVATVHQGADNLSPFVKIISVGPAGCIVEVEETTGINVALVGLTLLGAPAPVSGVAVDIIATRAG